MNKPRILVCFGRGPEIVDIISSSSITNQTPEFIWWCKHLDAYQAIAERAAYPIYFLSAVERLHSVCMNESIPKSTFPDSWIEQVVLYPRRLSKQANVELNERDLLYATALLSNAVRIIGLVKPNLLLIRGGTRLQEASFRIIAQELGIPMLLAERGTFPQSVFLDPNDTGSDILRPIPENSPDAPDNGHKCAVAGFIQNYMKTDLSAHEQPATVGQHAIRSKLGLRPSERIIFYAAQVEDDANMLLYSPSFLTNLSFLKYVASTMKGIEDAVLVVKPHPKEAKTIPDLSSEFGINMIVEREINIKDILPLASVVTTINSTVGFEALLYNKPVVVGGNAHYSHRGFTFDASRPDRLISTEELHAFLKNPFLTNEQIQQKDKYVEALLKHSLYFLEPAPGLNGPDDFVQRLICSAGETDYAIPLELLAASERFLNAYTQAAIPGSVSSGSLLRYVVRRGLLRTKKTFQLKALRRENNYG